MKHYTDDGITHYFELPLTGFAERNFPTVENLLINWLVQHIKRTRIKRA